MRVLGVGQRAYLGDIYLSLAREGHDVRVFGQDRPDTWAFGGILAPMQDWAEALRWVGRDGLLMFEGVGQGALQDRLRADGFRVVGGSALGDRLEADRGFGQQAMRDAGLPVAAGIPFPDPDAALRWLRTHPGRAVLKWNNGQYATFVGDHPEGADAAWLLRHHADGGPLLLMERLDGVEVGIGAYFDGQHFLRPACIDFEHKRFFPGDLGEMTGEMGTLASFQHADRLFEATLARFAPLLRQAGHRGYLNLNLMVNERGAWPLEFTARFGNPGFAVLAALQPDGWGDLLRRMADGGADGGTEVFRTDAGWSVCIVLTVPPFPARDDAAPPEHDPPLFFLRPPEGDAANYHLVDMRREDGQLRVHRRSGHAMIVTGTGATVEAAQAAAQHRARNVVAPDLRWRADIGERFIKHDRAALQRLGWLPEDLP